MDIQFRNNNTKINVWERDNHIATIAVHKYDKSFSIIVSGNCNNYGFKDSAQLKQYLKKNCCRRIELPEEVYDHIDAWTVMFKLT